MHPNYTDPTDRSMVFRCVVALIAISVGPALAQPKNHTIDVIQEQSHSIPKLLKRALVEDLSTLKEARLDLTALVMAYKPFIGQLDFSEDKPTLTLKGRVKVPWDDSLAKTFQNKLERPDLEDMMSLDYPRGPIIQPIPKDFDPGRFRVEALFKAVYGSTKKNVRKNLVPIRFCGKRILFNSQNGAAEALTRVGKDPEILVRERPNLREHIFPVSGTFNWRKIKGTHRLSPHSFGIAIDLNSRKRAYWRWNKRGMDIFEMRKRYPHEIVSIFEKHGFIWGGKWYHYDLMHFEYRPEFLMKERLQRLSSENY